MSNPQPSMFSHINLDQFVTLGHPMRKFRPLIDMDRIRAFCEPLYSDADPPSISTGEAVSGPPGWLSVLVNTERALIARVDWETGPLKVCGAGFGHGSVGSLHVHAEPDAADCRKRATRTAV